jgi:dipeptidyl aminopeptidase/acylaminoacyl peptidase
MKTKELQAGDLSILRWAGDAQLSHDGGRVAWVETTLDLELDRPVANIMVAPSAGGVPRRFTEGPGDSAPRWSPDGRYLAYVSVIDDSPALHLAPLAGGVPLRVDTPGPVSFVSWSASGDSLVLVVTVMADTPATDDPKVKNAPKLVRGMANRLDGRGYLAGRDQLFIYTAKDRSLRQLTSGDYDHRQPCWSPGGTTIACFSDRTRHRDDDWMFADLWLIPTGGGRSRKVASRVSAAGDPSFSPDGKRIAFVGAVGPARTLVGRNPRLLVIPADGSSQPIPVAPDLDRPVMAWFPVGNYAWLSNHELLFNVVDHGAISMQRAKLGERLARPVVAGDLQVTSLAVAKRGGTLLAAFTATWVDKPAEVFCLDLNADGARRRRLSDAGKGLLDAVDLLPARRFSAKARDGKEIEYFIISPRSPQSAPPMFLDIHGGPHGWNPFELAFHSYQVLAAAGYAVVLPNPRGSVGYGEEFAMAVNADWGGEDYHDLLACADDVIRRGLGDKDRQFVGGYSYGGYMSAWMIGHTDRFKAACVGAPVIDLVAEFGASDIGPLIAEDLGGDPWHPSGVLQERSPLTHVPNVNTPVFLYVFEGDLRCPPDQADALFNGLRWHRKEVEYARYPGGSHMSAADLAAPPSQSEDRLNRILDFLSQHGGVKTRRGPRNTKPARKRTSPKA